MKKETKHTVVAITVTFHKHIVCDVTSIHHTIYLGDFFFNDQLQVSEKGFQTREAQLGRGGLMPRPDYTGTSISSSLDAYYVLIFWENPCRPDRSGQVRSASSHHESSGKHIVFASTSASAFLRGRRWGGCD